MEKELEFRLKLADLQYQQFCFLLSSLLEQWRWGQPSVALPLLLKGIEQLKIWLRYFNKMDLLENYAQDEINIERRNEFGKSLDFYLNPVIFNENFIERMNLLVFEGKAPQLHLFSGTEQAPEIDLAKELTEQKHWEFLKRIYKDYAVLYAVAQSLKELPIRALFIAEEIRVPVNPSDIESKFINLPMTRKNKLIERAGLFLESAKEKDKSKPSSLRVINKAKGELLNWCEINKLDCDCDEIFLSEIKKRKEREYLAENKE